MKIENVRFFDSVKIFGKDNFEAKFLDIKGQRPAKMEYKDGFLHIEMTRTGFKTLVPLSNIQQMVPMAEEKKVSIEEAAAEIDQEEEKAKKKNR